MSAQPVTGDLRVWHAPQVPGKPFHVRVASIGDAKLVLSALADYDLFQLANNIKPDYCNAAGLEVFDDGEWCEWTSDDGYSIDEVDAEGVHA
ncbi:MAG TPA: hypothetical protein VF800_02760 [Telluria sp.]|jgi:hypothetical protein